MLEKFNDAINTGKEFLYNTFTFGTSAKKGEEELSANIEKAKQKLNEVAQEILAGKGSSIAKLEGIYREIGKEEKELSKKTYKQMGLRGVMPYLGSYVISSIKSRFMGKTVKDPIVLVAEDLAKTDAEIEKKQNIIIKSYMIIQKKALN